MKSHTCGKLKSLVALHHMNRWSKQNYRFKRKFNEGQKRMNIKNVWKHFIRIHSAPAIRHLNHTRTPMDGRNVEKLSITSPPLLNIRDFI